MGIAGNRHVGARGWETVRAPAYIDGVPILDKFPTRRFKPRPPPMAADVAARQGRAASLAFATFGERDAVMAFLNTHDETLGGRPIDLAIASPEGLAAVEAALLAKAP